MTTRQYHATKPSGVEWLGEVPNHWEVKRLKFSVRDAKNGVWGDDPTGEGDTRCVRVADFDRPHLLVGIEKTTYRSIPLVDLRNRGLSRDDLLLEKSGGGEKSPVGFVVRYALDEPAVCSNFVARVRLAPGMDSRFWTYVHHSNYQKLLTQRSIKQTSGIQNLDQQSYLDELVAFPEPVEQRQIADFLDRETAQIDELIAKQNALIDLLGERRKAVITQAVTRGLHGGAPTKQSYLGWLGLVPAHWTVGPLKRMLVGVQGGVSPQAEGGLTEGDEPGVLRSGCVNGGRFNDEEHKRLPAGFPVPVGIRVRLGDVLVCRASGSVDLVGSCAIVTRLRFNLILSDKTFRLTPTQSASGRFLAWLLNSAPYRTQVAMSVSGAEGLANNLPSSSLKNFTFAIPPLREQLEIADKLDRRTGELDLLTSAARRAVELLRERRAALIAAAVTGKIDVRGAA